MITKCLLCNIDNVYSNFTCCGWAYNKDSALTVLIGYEKKGYIVRYVLYGNKSTIVKMENWKEFTTINVAPKFANVLTIDGIHPPEHYYRLIDMLVFS